MTLDEIVKIIDTEEILGVVISAKKCDRLFEIRYIPHNDEFALMFYKVVSVFFAHRNIDNYEFYFDAFVTNSVENKTTESLIYGKVWKERHELTIYDICREPTRLEGKDIGDNYGGILLELLDGEYPPGPAPGIIGKAIDKWWIDVGGTVRLLH